jgi:hypothetical protein
MCNEFIIDVTCFKALVTSYTTNQSKQEYFYKSIFINQWFNKDQSAWNCSDRITPGS